MKMIWFIYSNHNDTLRKRYKRKYILAIVLSDLYGKLHVLESSKLTNADALLVRTYTKELSNMNPEKRMRWLKDRIATFNNAYKTIYKDRIKIMNEYEIPPLGVE